MTSWTRPWGDRAADCGLVWWHTDVRLQRRSLKIGLLTALKIIGFGPIKGVFRAPNGFSCVSVVHWGAVVSPRKTSVRPPAYWDRPGGSGSENRLMACCSGSFVFASGRRPARCRALVSCAAAMLPAVKHARMKGESSCMIALDSFLLAYATRPSRLITAEPVPAKEADYAGPSGRIISPWFECWCRSLALLKRGERCVYDAGLRA